MEENKNVEEKKDIKDEKNIAQDRVKNIMEGKNNEGYSSIVIMERDFQGHLSIRRISKGVEIVIINKKETKIEYISNP